MDKEEMNKLVLPLLVELPMKGEGNIHPCPAPLCKGTLHWKRKKRGLIIKCSNEDCIDFE